MKKYLITLLLILTVIYKAKCQNITENYFIGNWKVKNIEIIKIVEDLGDEKQMLMMKNAFLKSRFEFKADKHFNLKIALKDMAITNEHWKFSEMENIITIQEWKDIKNKNSITMEIKVSEIDNKIYFLLIETPFKLEMIKE